MPPSRALSLALPLLITACANIPAYESSSATSPSVRQTKASGSLDVPDPFPTEDALAQIAERPVPDTTQLLGDSVAPVDAWTFHGRGAQTAEVVPYVGDDPNAQALATVLAQEPNDRQVTRGMQCVAREFGAFVLAHGDEPAGDISGFIAARCGTTVVRPFVMTHRMPIEEMPQRPFHAHKDAKVLRSMLSGIGPASNIGMWVGRGEHEGVLSVAWGVPDVDISPVVLAVPGRQQIELRGRVRWDYDNLSGYVTRGAMGALPCRPITSERVEAPEFALRCPVSSGDPMTVVELHASPRGRLLGRRVLRTVVNAKDSVPLEYQAPSLPLPIGPDEHDEVALAAGISALRRKAQLPPVRASKGQSEVLSDLLPHFLAATAEPDHGELADEIALGMIAGRRIEGDIRWGTFFSSGAPNNWSLERHIAAELLSPYSRSRLLDPEATTVAYANLSDPSHAMRRSVIATYSEFSDRDYTEQIAAFFNAVDRQRSARGQEPVLRVHGPNDARWMSSLARQVRDGDLDPEQALDQMLGHFVEQTQRDFRGMVLLPVNLDGWEPMLDGPVLDTPRLAMAVTISHFRPPGAAWGRNLVLVAFTEL